MLSDSEFVAVYGRWASRTPQDAAGLFDGYRGVWWIAGGWALQAFTGVERHHEDLDPSVLSAELPLLRRHLAERLHVWTAASGALWPLLPDDRPDADADDVLPDGTHQLWTRRTAEHPWEYDILLSPGTAQEWIYRRDPSIRMPLGDALWERDGIRYLQPEIQLLYKARGQRPKDDADFSATTPHLDGRRRDWLRGALERTIPGHAWISRL
ncbi:hypothetical protein AB0269_05245 [Microbacterium sp. NPDC077644]|uniref:hypothetical protein n=1 Tax=Microbacterium sp. NPDC077644 TaxID=3155055 RepID=UPI00344F12AC